MDTILPYRWLLMGFIAWALLTMPVSAGEPMSTLAPFSAAVNAPDTELEFDFYGQQLCVVKVATIKVKSVHEHDVVKAWHDYQKERVDTVLSSLRWISDEMGLNDWFTFELVRNYADQLLSVGSPMDRVLLEHFLLVGLGYDVRLARTERQLLLLVPIEQEVYERGFIKIDGKNYYLFYDDLESNENERSVIYPCDPSKKHLGKGQVFSLKFKDKPLNLQTGTDKECFLDDGQIHVECSVNGAVMRMLRNYPLMDLQCYANSVVLLQFRQVILEQLRPQLEDLSQCEAANALLHFVQYVFDYEDDSELFGRNKVNFVEENFYYDKNDCEDRSILYAYLVQSLLGLDVHIIQYPGHECTAVRFTDCFTSGFGYYYGEDYYLICDPTYIGASIGKCMSRYRSIQPVVIEMQTTLESDTIQSPLHPRLDKVFAVPEVDLKAFGI